MKVYQLRTTLQCLGLPASGLKDDLANRLIKEYERVEKITEGFVKSTTGRCATCVEKSLASEREFTSVVGVGQRRSTAWWI